MSLQNPLAKMSKSDADPNATIYLSDSDDVIRKKIKRAVTDSGSEITFEDTKPGVKNLLTIQSTITGKAIEKLVAEYAGKQYGHLKVETAELVAQTIRPIRERAESLLKEKTELNKVLRQGAEKARQLARPTVDRLYQCVGFVP